MSTTTEVIASYKTNNQNPLDAKGWAATLSELKSLGIDSYKAFQYYEGLEIRCAEDNNVYIWRREVVEGESNGLIEIGGSPSSYTYPGAIGSKTVYVNGIDYSGLTFNLFPEVAVKPSTDIDIKDDGKLNFADRATVVNSQTSEVQSLGYKYIKDTFDFTSIPTGYDNSKLEIRDFFDLEGGTITLPEKAELFFNGGKIQNAFIVGNKTKISAGLEHIFGSNVTFSGTWDIQYVRPEWFGAIGDGLTDDSDAFLSALIFSNATKIPIKLISNEYNVLNLSFTATNNLKIIGSDKDKTILKNIGAFILNEDLYLENLTILDTTARDIFTFNPNSFSNVTLKNVKATNTDSAFTDTLRARSLIYRNNASLTEGIDNLIIQNCEFSNFSAYFVRLSTNIKRGSVSNSKFFNLGYDDSPSVSCLYFGSNTNDVTTLEVIGNTFENIFSQYGASNDSTEVHFILGYGDSFYIENNICKNIYGGGRLETNLECGQDHEAIYLKAASSRIVGNYVLNSVGEEANGAITIKADSKGTIISENFIDLLYGSGIYTLCQNAEIKNNTVFLRGSTTFSNSCCEVVDVLDSEIIKVDNNKLFNLRTGSTNGGCVLLVNPNNISLDNNYMYSENALCIRATGTPTTSTPFIQINSNIFKTVNAIFCSISITNLELYIKNNKFSFTLDGGSTTKRLIDLTLNNGSLKLNNNQLTLYGQAETFCRILSYLKYEVKNNSVTVLSGAVSMLNFLRVYNETQNNKIHYVNDNIIDGDGNLRNLINYQYGDGTITRAIGTVHVNNNSVGSGIGSLIDSAGLLVADNLIVQNNYISTTVGASDVLIEPANQPTNFINHNNIEL